MGLRTDKDDMQRWVDSNEPIPSGRIRRGQLVGGEPKRHIVVRWDDGAPVLWVGGRFSNGEIVDGEIYAVGGREVSQALELISKGFL